MLATGQVSSNTLLYHTALLETSASISFPNCRMAPPRRVHSATAPAPVPQKDSSWHIMDIYTREHKENKKP